MPTAERTSSQEKISSWQVKAEAVCVNAWILIKIWRQKRYVECEVSVREEAHQLEKHCFISWILLSHSLPSLPAGASLTFGPCYATPQKNGLEMSKPAAARIGKEKQPSPIWFYSKYVWKTRIVVDVLALLLSILISFMPLNSKQFQDCSSISSNNGNMAESGLATAVVHVTYWVTSIHFPAWNDGRYYKPFQRPWRVFLLSVLRCIGSQLFFRARFPARGLTLVLFVIVREKWQNLRNLFA